METGLDSSPAASEPTLPDGVLMEEITSLWFIARIPRIVCYTLINMNFLSELPCIRSKLILITRRN